MTQYTLTAQRMRQCRERLGLTQVQVAENLLGNADDPLGAKSDLPYTRAEIEDAMELSRVIERQRRAKPKAGDLPDADGRPL